MMGVIHQSFSCLMKVQNSPSRDCFFSSCASGFSGVDLGLSSLGVCSWRNHSASEERPPIDSLPEVRPQALNVLADQLSGASSSDSHEEHVEIQGGERIGEK